MADLNGAYAKAVSWGPTPSSRSMAALRAWIIANGGPTLNDLNGQYAWIFAYTPPGNGGGGGGGGGSE